MNTYNFHSLVLIILFVAAVVGGYVLNVQAANGAANREQTKIVDREFQRDPGLFSAVFVRTLDEWLESDAQRLEKFHSGIMDYFEIFPEEADPSTDDNFATLYRTNDELRPILKTTAELLLLKKANRADRRVRMVLEESARLKSIN